MEIKIEKIEIVKEGIYFTLYVNDIQLGCGGLKEILYDLSDYLKAYKNGEFDE